MASRPNSTRALPLLLVAALATALPILWSFALPVLNASDAARHGTHGLTLYVHVSAGTAMIILGAAALYIGWTKKAFRRHKWFGYSYIVVGSCNALAGLLLSIRSPHPPHSLSIATGTVAVVWLAFTAMALRAALNKRFDAHKEWMVRSYVITWSFVGCRLSGFIPLFPSLGAEGVTAMVWLNWIAPVLICELVLQWKLTGKVVHKGAAPVSPFQSPE